MIYSPPAFFIDSHDRDRPAVVRKLEESELSFPLLIPEGTSSATESLGGRTSTTQADGTDGYRDAAADILTDDSAIEETRKSQLMATLLDENWLGAKALAVVLGEGSVSLSRVAEMCEAPTEKVAVTLVCLAAGGAIRAADPTHVEATAEGELIGENLGLVDLLRRAIKGTGKLSP